MQGNRSTGVRECKYAKIVKIEEVLGGNNHRQCAMNHGWQIGHSIDGKFLYVEMRRKSPQPKMYRVYSFFWVIVFIGACSLSVLIENLCIDTKLAVMAALYHI